MVSDWLFKKWREIHASPARAQYSNHKIIFQDGGHCDVIFNSSGDYNVFLVRFKMGNFDQYNYLFLCCCSFTFKFSWEWKG
jgi:hypothetical protein